MRWSTPAKGFTDTEIELRGCLDESASCRLADATVVNVLPFPTVELDCARREIKQAPILQMALELSVRCPKRPFVMHRTEKHS